MRMTRVSDVPWTCSCLCTVLVALQGLQLPDVEFWATFSGWWLGLMQKICPKDCSQLTMVAEEKRTRWSSGCQMNGETRSTSGCGDNKEMMVRGDQRTTWRKKGLTADKAKQMWKIAACLSSASVYSGFTREGEWKKSRSENVKIIKKNKKQTLLLHRKSTGMAQLIWSVGLWSDYAQSFPHVRLRCHYNIFTCAFTSA